MNLLVKEKHEGYGIFPLFTKGTAISKLEESDEYPHWCACMIDEHETFIPDIYVVDGVLTQDYNPTELIVNEAQIVVLIDIVFEWLYVKDENDRRGWIPASKAISI